MLGPLFWRSDVEKVHAVVARSPSQSVKNWSFGAFFDVQMSKKWTLINLTNWTNFTNLTHSTTTTTTQQLQLQLHNNYNSTTLQLGLQLQYTTLHPAVVGEVTTATIATTPTNTSPTTFRSISGFALPSVIHIGFLFWNFRRHLARYYW